jgi:hypothetical protein
MLATGDIKKYQIIVGGLNLSVFPLAYIAFKLGLPPYSSYVIQFVVYGIELAARVILLKGMIKLPIRKYINEVLFRVLLVVFFAALLPIIITNSMQENLIRLFVVTGVCVLCTFSSIYLLGLSKEERIWVNGKLKNAFVRIASK